MENYNLKKGVIYGAIAVFTIGLQPVISNSRPSIIDPFLFGTITAIIEAMLFLPIFLLERYKLKQNLVKLPKLYEKNNSLLYGWKKKNNIKILILVGLIFSAVPILLYVGYELAGVINSSLSLKSEIIFAIIFGFLILHEKITKIQVIFCCFLFFGLILAITNGSFNLLELNLGTLIILFSVGLFTLVHTIVKLSFAKKELFPSQLVFLRNLFSGVLLTIIYFLVFPLESLRLVINPEYFPFFLFMGIDYGISLYLWYKMLTYIQIGKASIIISLTPLVSAFFSFIFLGDVITIFHFIGTIIIIFSIYMIVKEKPKNLT